MSSPSKLQLVERQNNALHELNEIAAISDASPIETLRKALAIGQKYFGLEFGIVSHIVGEEYTVDVQSSPANTLYDSQLFALGSTYCKTTLEIDDVLAITDVTKSKYVGHPCHRELALVSYIGAPIRVNSEVYGTINFSSPSARQLEYDAIDDEFMRLLSRWTGTYLEKQLVLDELSFAKKRFELIFENNAAGILLVNSACQMKMANKRLCEIIGYSKEELIGRDSKMIHIDDTLYETIKNNFLNAKRDSNAKIKYQLKRKDGSYIWCEFSGASISLAKNETNVIWSVLDITAEKELQEEVERQAITDYLTSLYNRRYFTNRVEQEISRVKRGKSAPVSLVMFDLDYFKRVNDEMGHVVGDDVIKKFANTLKSNLRQSDIAGRIGGEEFAMILPDTDMPSAMVLANRIREEVSNLRLAYGKKSVSFTVSVGVTILSERDIGFNTAFSRADSALYLAKENGRNRVESQE
jgi:diguanylate cyclase (GGDEF)-like protein/PAS domain S-box-containing protein